MDLGTLRFARNGRDLGLAVQGLEGTLYPAVSMYNRYYAVDDMLQGKHCHQGLGNVTPSPVATNSKTKNNPAYLLPPVLT